MSDVPWDNPATLYRATDIGGEEDAFEEEIARGTVYELVGEVLEMSPEQQRGLMLRTAEADRVLEYDGDAIRELAAEDEFTGAR